MLRLKMNSPTSPAGTVCMPNDGVELKVRTTTCPPQAPTFKRINNTHYFLWKCAKWKTASQGIDNLKYDGWEQLQYGKCILRQQCLTLADGDRLTVLSNIIRFWWQIGLKMLYMHFVEPQSGEGVQHQGQLPPKTVLLFQVWTCHSCL